MDYRSNYSASSMEYVEIDEKNIKREVKDYNNKNEKVIKDDNNSNNQLSPFLTQIMKYGLIIEFLMVTISLIQYIINGNWYGNDSVDKYWPISNFQVIFISSIVMNGTISAWKGLKVDKRLFFAIHHLVTMGFFLGCFYFTEIPPVRFYGYLELYLIMRIVKRFKDEGNLNKDQWVLFYVLYAYTMTFYIVIINSISLMESNIIDLIGAVAHIDSLITCRKEDIFSKYLLLSNNNDKLISFKLLKKEPIQIILSILDVVILWSILIIGSGWLNIFKFQFYVFFSTFLFIELLIKPSFKSFKRPYCYKFSNHGSFPSSHTALLCILVSITPLSPIQRIISIILMGIYRVYTRAHTVEDVCAGIVFGLLFFKVFHIIAIIFNFTFI